MLDHPWIRLLLGVLAAAALGALAARVAGSVPGASGPSSAVAPGADGSRTRPGGGAEAEGAAGPGGGASAGGGSGGVELSGGSGRLTVHVTGAVRRPGVYRLREGARIFEAVRKAGGASARADRQRLNLAAAVRDGQQVLVPERVAPVGSGGPTNGGEGSASGGGGGAGGAGAGGAAPVDLNTAGVEELQGLEGVGPTTAAKIVRLREERGGLGGVDDLDDVPGIGPKKLEALRAQLEP